MSPRSPADQLDPGGSAQLATEQADRLVNQVRRSVAREHDVRRPVFRHGLVASGVFTPNQLGDVGALTTASHFTGEPCAAIVRFSTFRRDDWRPKPDVRGLSCRLIDEAGAQLDLVAVTTPRFLVRRVEDFHRLPPAHASLLRSLPRLIRLVASRRTTLLALWTLLRHTRLPRLVGGHGVRQLAWERYFCLHTYWLVRDDRRRATRLHWRPLNPEKLRGRQLDGTVRQLLQAGGFELELVADVADPDPPNRMVTDSLRRWPSWVRDWPLLNRRTRWGGTTRVELGTLSLTNLEGANHPAEQRWVFNPVPAVVGFEASDDPILRARAGAMVASQVRRLQ